MAFSEALNFFLAFDDHYFLKMHTHSLSATVILPWHVFRRMCGWNFFFSSCTLLQFVFSQEISTLFQATGGIFRTLSRWVAMGDRSADRSVLLSNL